MSAVQELIWQDADRVSGAVCFYATRIPVQDMLDYVDGGQTLQEFSGDYNIPLEQAKGVLETIGLDSPGRRR